MRVVFLNPSGEVGGAEAVLLDLFATLPHHLESWQPALIASAEGPLAQRARALGVPTTILPFPARLDRLGEASTAHPPRPLDSTPTPRAVAHRPAARRARFAAQTLLAAPAILGYARRLRRELDGLQPDLLHTNGFKMHILGLWARRRTPTAPAPPPIVWHVHDYVSPRPLMAHLLRHHSRRVAQIVTNSRSVAADVERRCAGRAPVRTIENGIDLARFAPEVPDLDRKAGNSPALDHQTGPHSGLDLDRLAGLPSAPYATVRVGLLATFAAWKGHSVFLQALAGLPATTPVRGYVLGGPLYTTAGSQRDIATLEREAERLGLTGRVGFTGFVDDPAAALRALDIVVHASTDPEPFGLVIAQAMACGKPVIASRSGGAADLIHEDEDALAHTPGDAAELAHQITRLATDPALRDRLGSAARRSAVERFDRERMARAWVEMYRRVLPATP